MFSVIHEWKYNKNAKVEKNDQKAGERSTPYRYRSFKIPAFDVLNTASVIWFTFELFADSGYQELNWKKN